jgi:hypothetical protein
MSEKPTDIGLNYSREQLMAAIVAGQRTIRYRYERLDKNLQSIDYLDSVESAKISYNYLADIKRTASFTIVESDQEVDYFNQLIRPYVGILMDDGLWTHIPVGTFLLSSPSRARANGKTVRDVRAYDFCSVIRTNYNDTRYQIAAGAIVTDAVIAICDQLGLQQNIKPSATVAPALRAWDPGTSYGVIINDLLNMIGYGSIYFTPLGVATASEYIEPALRAITFQYATDEFSILTEEASETLDTFDIPNQWVFVVSQPDRPVLTSTYTNNVATSPTSVQNRGRTVEFFDNQRDEADQAALDLACRKKAQEDSQIYSEVAVSTALNPLHDESETIMLTHDPLGIEKTVYNEMSWEMDLGSEEALMTHSMRRTVAV